MDDPDDVLHKDDTTPDTHEQPSRWRRYTRRGYRVIHRIFVYGLIFLVSLLFLSNFVLSTQRVADYRTLHPNSEICRQGLQDGWTILSATDPARANAVDNDGWIDPSNDENQAVNADGKRWSTAFRCALQKHIVPSQISRDADLTYHLGFLEFKESGEPYPLVDIDADGQSIVPSANLTDPSPRSPGQRPIITQLDALRSHLAQGSNYVIVFIHGWRHDARIGDGNVADLRHYAAHVARFLKMRCALEGLYCDTSVTAIYVGWRGARVDEAGLKRYLGSWIGGTVGNLAAMGTLFDRKPVSEQVAPGAISALRTIEADLSTRTLSGKTRSDQRVNRMIVFGHSLGGNLLATGLEDDVIKLVRLHKPGRLADGEKPAVPAAPFPHVLGDLVVLINPASEAAKWTAIQREVWNRVPFHVDENTTLEEVEAGHAFFRTDQKPVVISVTSALSFPPGGVRKSDCEWLDLPGSVATKKALKKRFESGTAVADVDYDWATQDLFPTFKFDFRPLAARIDRLSASLEGRTSTGCDGLRQREPWWHRLMSLPAQGLSKFIITLPFQNTNQEMSHTIGHLDPPRPAAGRLTEKLTSALPFGTTHEMFGLLKAHEERHHAYASLPDADLGCMPANGWLTRARKQVVNGTQWDSARLAPPTGATGEGPPAAQFLQGSNLSGTAPITRATDPFWNIRAFDNALARHDGYRLSSFICAMNQFVMDDITGAPLVLPNAAADPPAPVQASLPQ